MKITFYGVRGSTPTPGKDTLEFGGNTSCVYVQLANGDDVILDAGTGIRLLGEHLSASRDDISILLTHHHWDHIQGFPFFNPIYQKDRNISVIPGNVDSAEKNSVLTQMSGANHPVKYYDLPSNITLQEQYCGCEHYQLKSFEVRTQALNHPDGGNAYALYGDGKKMVYVTDNELLPLGETRTSWQQWLEFIADADVLIHDAQYTDEDMVLKRGWGHSTLTQAAELAAQACVKQLFIISHDPMRTDSQLLQQEQILQEKFHQTLMVTCAREGTCIDLGTEQH
jgi:phosphoribosyl 1,2-cyclic phosphodiesterase